MNRIYTFFVFTMVLFVGCQQSDSQSTEESSEWIDLFNGKNFDGWESLGSDTILTNYWKIDNGILKKMDRGDVPAREDGQPFTGGDLITVETFDNFELSFEWRAFKAGNSGLKYNVSKEISKANGSSRSAIGFEYQLLDDGDEEYAGKLKPSQYTGCLYDMFAPSNTELKPLGEFNTSRILVDGNHVEHWLNGVQVLTYELGSEALEEAYKKSKFAKIPNYHHKRKGHLVLQDHTTEAWFRNIKIRKL
ncbi:3-keto-disaccharide hydrolase [Membranihabitans marinus]|uniref:3-keto-disaccharide hydrolase n=1 Tax=Membranihabitans marinus TaxID=1227546 RepID=UPI001F44CE13|nr:DUF1080 domain-containing protein [Membranihabitans marinus]